MPVHHLKRKIQANPRMIPWFVWGCAVVFYIYQFILRVAPTVLADDWMSDFHINTAALGFLSAGFYYTYVLMQIPVGILMDKLGPRIFISFASCICAAGCFLISYTHHFSTAVISRSLIGLGAACGFLGCMKIATLWFPKHKLGLLAGLTTSLGTIGALLGNLPLALLTYVYPWRLVLLGLGVCGLVIAFIIFAGIRNASSTAYHPTHEHHPSLRKGLVRLVKQPQVWIFSLFGFCMYTPISAFTDLWSVPFFKQALHLSEAQATSLNSFSILGLIASGPVFAWISERLQSHRNTMRISALGLLITFSALCLSPSLHPVIVAVFCFLFGLAFGGEVLCFAGVCSLMPHNMGGLSAGFTNMIVMLSGTLFQPIVGWLLQKYGTYEMINGAPVYSPESFQMAFFPIILLLLCAVSFTFGMKETYTTSGN